MGQFERSSTPGCCLSLRGSVHSAIDGCAPACREYSLPSHAQGNAGSHPGQRPSNGKQRGAERYARIVVEADGGEILVADVVRQLVAGKEFLFNDRGDTELRGFEDPVRVYEVRWQE